MVGSSIASDEEIAVALRSLPILSTVLITVCISPYVVVVLSAIIIDCIVNPQFVYIIAVCLFR